MYNNIKEQFKNFKEKNDHVNPDRVWVMKNKELLLKQIENNVSSHKAKFHFSNIWEMTNVIFPGRMVYSVVRPMVVFVLIAGVATSGWIAGVSATADSLPGDLGYNVKLATEKTREIVTAVTGSENQEAQMHMEFASRRAKEVKKVVEENNEGAPKKVEVAIKHLEKSISSANDKIKEVGEKTPEKIMEATKAITEKSKEINFDLKEASKQEGSENIAEAKKKVTEVGLTAVEAVVKAKENGSLEVSDDDVKDLVLEQINNILAEVDEIKTEAQAVVRGLEETDVLQKQDIVSGAEVDNLINSSSTPTSDIIITITATSTITTSSDILPAVGEVKTISNLLPTSAGSLTEVKTVVDEALKKINETGDGAVKDLTDAKTMVQNNQISQALEKVRQITGTTQATEKAVIEVKKVVNTASQNIPVTNTNNLTNSSTPVIIESKEGAPVVSPAPVSVEAPAPVVR
ncbi:MAG: hypothetical protein ABIJ23_03305 [Candidatus Magasanikbacteria bacterium]